mmetsp:Transcript_19607/g.52020  ORF Transcript_19607/g.52020 Transcript_19607/m.52020 type:complete len:210 (+) Transcript_19607:85-714(+)
MGGGAPTRCLLVAAALLLPPRAAAHSQLQLLGSQGQSHTFVGKPAVWNAWLPNFGRPKLSASTPLDRESYNLNPSFYGRVFMADNVTRSLACEPMASTVRVEAMALLVERGLCSFREKARNAYKAGFTALIVANTVGDFSKVPDMTAAPESDNDVEVPAWSVSTADGAELRDWLQSDHSIRLEVIDNPRRTPLGVFQADAYGLRNVLRI